MQNTKAITCCILCFSLVYPFVSSKVTGGFFIPFLSELTSQQSSVSFNNSECLPAVELSVLVYLKLDESVPQLLSARTQVSVEVVTVEAEHTQGYSDPQ